MNDTRREKIAPFIKGLWEILDGNDLGTLAELRRLDDDRLATALAGRVGWLLPPHLNRQEEDAYLLVARLFATVRSGARSSGEDLGKVLGHLAGERGETPDRSDKGLERRVVALLSADLEDLPERLTRVLALARNSASVAHLDWAALLADVLSWESPSQFVQRHWARNFVNTRRPTKSEGGSEEFAGSNNRESDNLQEGVLA